MRLSAMFVFTSILLFGCASAQLTEKSGLITATADVSEAAEAWQKRDEHAAVPKTLVVEHLAFLPDAVKETSGLALRHGRLWTHNDSGNTATLFELSAAGDAIQRSVQLQNAVNVDWEALAQDDTTLYIADCGNNIGDRAWLQIYKIAWRDLDQVKEGGTVAAQRIDVRLADTQAERKRHAHNNDCEALTVVGDELWLFTKNWQDQNTRLYRIDKETSKQQVTTSAEFGAKGLITGADYDPVSQRLALIGYRFGFLNVGAFIWLVPVTDNAPNWDRASYHNISPVAQWEAILWQQGKLLLSSELSLLGRARLAKVSLAPEE